jgi:hypothetical protein
MAAKWPPVSSSDPARDLGVWIHCVPDDLAPSAEDRPSGGNRRRCLSMFSVVERYARLQPTPGSSSGQRVRPARPRQAIGRVTKVGFGNVDLKRPDRYIQLFLLARNILKPLIL